MVYSLRVTDAATTKPAADDRWIRKFLAHLATDRDASVYTQRNYRQALLEFVRWHQNEQAAFADDPLRRDTPSPGKNCNAMIFAVTSGFWAGRTWAARRFNCASARCGRFTSF